MSVFNQPSLIVITIISGVIALLIAIFQYYYNTSKKRKAGKVRVLLAFLRFLSVFTLLILLFDPKITINTIEKEKPELVLLQDQSESMAFLKVEGVANKFTEKITTDPDLQRTFSIYNYDFANDLIWKDSVNDSIKKNKIGITNKQSTYIYNALKSTETAHKKNNTTKLILSDGNQNIGIDYAYYKTPKSQKLYSVVFGDTTKIADLKVNSVNVNKYVNYNNTFPVEFLVNYTGNTSLDAKVTIYHKGKAIYKKELHFKSPNDAQFINTTIKAKELGIQNYKIVVTTSGLSEKNTQNNTQYFSVETIDKKTRIAIIASTIHPDISCIKRSLESEKNRKVQVLKPAQVTTLKNIDFVICYQPDSEFSAIYKKVQKSQIPIFTFTGERTDWTFLNEVQKAVYKDPFSSQIPTEILGYWNPNFELFYTDDFSMQDYPPITTQWGKTQLQPDLQPLLYQSVKGIPSQKPLLALDLNTTLGKANSGYFFGEGIWKWRIACFKRDGNFDAFDGIWGKITQLITQKKKKNHLEVQHEKKYYQNETLQLKATFYNAAFEIDRNAQLKAQLIHLKTKSRNQYPLSFTGKSYQAEIGNLQKGEYRLIVKEQRKGDQYTSGFVVRENSLEGQLQSPDMARMSKIALRNSGKLFFSDQFDALKKELLRQENSKPVLKTITKQKTLLEFPYLLIAILILLAIEWFVRKYNGLT